MMLVRTAVIMLNVECCVFKAVWCGGLLEIKLPHLSCRSVVDFFSFLSGSSSDQRREGGRKEYDIYMHIYI